MRAPTAGLTAGLFGTLRTRWKLVIWVRAASWPRRSWALRGDAAGERDQHRSVRVAGREGELDAALHVLDAHCDFHERTPDRIEGRAAPDRAPGCRPAQRMQQPVGSHVQEEPELIGLPARARGLVGARVEFHILDQVLHAPARAVHLLVENLSSTFEVGDDEAHVGPHVCRLDAGDDLALLAPA